MKGRVAGVKIDFEYEAGIQSSSRTFDRLIPFHFTFSPFRMVDSETQKLIHEAQSALQNATEALEDSLAGTKTSLRKTDKKLTQEVGALQKGLERVLGGKSLFWVEEPVDGRRLANNMAGWGAFGVAVHAWHRGIQRMPVLGARE
jgi:hypothetical protein